MSSTPNGLTARYSNNLGQFKMFNVKEFLLLAVLWFLKHQTID